VRYVCLADPDYRGYDCTNFRQAVESMLGARVDRDTGIVTYRGRQTRVDAYPVGVEWNNEVVRSTPPAPVCRERVRRDLELSPDVMLGVGIDRLDYTKGINEKFLAIERLLERRLELRGRFAFVQVAEPSRECLADYRSARDQLVATASRVNDRSSSWRPRPLDCRPQRRHDTDKVVRCGEST
jgi:trehalose 6-phosphate synthase